MPASTTEPLAQNWCALQVLHDRISARLERALQDAHGISVREYSLLAMLDRQTGGDGGHYQVKELAHGLAISQSATTRLIDRLERRGLLERYICPTDRRGVYTEITPEGRKTLASAAPTNNAALDEALDDLAANPEFTALVNTLRNSG